MGPDLELKGRLCNMASLDNKINPGEPVDKNMSCISNYQNDIMELEASGHRQTEQVKQFEKSRVKITESTHQSENPLDGTASQDETENSSSFGNTLSGDENDESLSDSEVMSKPHDNELNQECRMRRKSLTSHWNTFIQPYMWRCRWAELKIRQLLYQASKYDLQAEAISRSQQLTSKNSTVEDSGSKLLPFLGSMPKGASMQRRKRKRVEDLTDTAAYMAQHPLFSYIGCKKGGADVASSLNDRANIGIPAKKRVAGNYVFGCSDEPVSLEFRNDDNSLEQILWKIGVLQSHLGELKIRFKKVYDENAKDIYSADAMNLNDVSTIAAQTDVSTNERDKLVQVSNVASQPMPECNRCDMLKRRSAISTHGEDTNLIDIIEFNDKLQIGISCEKEGNGHFKYKSTATELNNTKKVKIQPTEKVEVHTEMVEVQPIEEFETQPTEKVETQPTEKFEIQPTENVEMQPTEKPETPKNEEQANIVLPVPVPVTSISDDQPETRKEEQANMISPVQRISITDDEPSPKKRSISGLTSPDNTRKRGRGRGRGRRRRGSRWSRKA